LKAAKKSSLAGVPELGTKTSWLPHFHCAIWSSVVFSDSPRHRIESGRHWPVKSPSPEPADSQEAPRCALGGCPRKTPLSFRLARRTESKLRHMSQETRRARHLPEIGRSAVRVESNFHLHLSASICLCEAITSSNAGSGAHCPTRSVKSALTGLPMSARVNSSRTTRFRLCFRCAALTRRAWSTSAGIPRIVEWTD